MKTDKYDFGFSSRKSYSEDPDQIESKAAEEAYVANMKLIKKQKARFKRLERVLSRNVFLIPLCAIFSIISAVSLFVSTLSDHYEHISYNMVNIKKHIDYENNKTLATISSKIKKEFSHEDLMLVRKHLEEYRNRSNQYVIPTVDIKTKILYNLINEHMHSINMYDIEFYQDYYILSIRNYLEINKSSISILLYETYSGIWKFCNTLSTESRKALDVLKCSFYKIGSYETEQNKVKKLIDLADPGRDLVRMHNAAACCTIVCYCLLITSWITALSAAFSKKVPLTFATCVLNMLAVVFLVLLLAIFHRKIVVVDLKPSCGDSSLIFRIVCQNKIVKLGYSLGMTWLALLFTIISSISWLYITKMQKLLLAHGYFY